MQKRYLLGLISLFATLLSFSQAVYRSNANIGSWTSATSWNLLSGADDDLNGVPDANDSVIIRTGHVMYVSGTQACRGLKFLPSAGSDTTTLIITAGATLNVTSASGGSGKVDMSQTNSRHLLMTVLGTVNTSSDFTIASSNNGYVIVNIGASGYLDVNGTLKMENTDGWEENMITGTPAANPTGSLFCDSLAMIQPNDGISEDNLLQHHITVTNGAYMYIPTNAGYVNSITGNITVGRGLTMDNDADFPNYNNTITGNVTITGNLTMTAVTADNIITGSVSLAGGSVTMSSTTDGENTIGNGLTATGCTGFSMTTSGGSSSFSKNQITGNVSLSGSLSTITMNSASSGDGSSYSNRITGSLTSDAGALTMTLSNSGINAIGGLLSIPGHLSMTAGGSGDNTIGSTVSCNNLTMLTQVSGGVNSISGAVTAAGIVDIDNTNAGSNAIGGNLIITAGGALTMDITGSGGNTISGTLSSSGTLWMSTTAGGDNSIGAVSSCSTLTMRTSGAGGNNAVGGNVSAAGLADIDNSNSGNNTISGDLTISGGNNLTMDITSSGNNSITGAVSTGGTITLTTTGSGTNTLGSISSATGVSLIITTSTGSNTVNGTTNHTGNLSLSTTSGGVNTLTGNVTSATGSISMTSSGNGGNHLGANLTATGNTGFTMQTSVTASTGANVIDGNVAVTGNGNVLITSANTGDESPFLIILYTGNNVSNTISGTADFNTNGSFTMSTTGGNSCSGENHINGALTLTSCSSMTISAGSAADNELHATVTANSPGSGLTFITTGSGITGDNLVTGRVTGNTLAEVYLTAGSDGTNDLNDGVSLTATGGLHLQTTGGDGFDGQNTINGNSFITATTVEVINGSDGNNTIDGMTTTLSGDILLTNNSTAGSGGRSDVTVNGTSSADDILLTSATLEGQNTLRIEAALTCTGNTGLSFTSGANTGTDGVTGADNRVIIGDGTTAGTLTLKGLSMTSPAGTVVRNELLLFNGTVDLNGNMTLSGSSQTRNQIRWDDAFGSGDGYNKEFFFSGTISDVSSASLLRDDADDDAAFTFTFDGTNVQQTIPGNNAWNFKRIDVTNTFNTVLMGGTLSRANDRLRGRLKLYDGVTLQDNANSFGGTGNDSIQMLASTRFVISNLTDAFPQNIEYVSVSSSGVIEFSNSSASTQAVLGGTGTVKTLYKVEGTGSGVKEVQANLSAANISVENIHLKGGTWTFTAASALTFNLRSDANSPTQTFTAEGFTTLKIPRDFAAVPSMKYSFDYMSTVEYSRAGNQSVYKMNKNTPGSGQLAPLGNLTLSGSGVKDLLIADSVKVRRKLTVGSGTTLEISNNSILILASDASYTAWVGAVLGSITYNGTGKIVAQRYLYLPTRIYRDYSSPIKNSTLLGWKADGISFSGFPGSNFETLNSNAFKYNETLPGDLDQRFTTATNITNAIHTFDGGSIIQGGWRLYTGNALGRAYLLQDSGQIYTGDISFKTTFTHTSDTLLRALDDGWNFLGNPYAAAIDWEAVVSDAANTAFMSDSLSNGLSPTFYQYMPYHNGVGNVDAAYSSYNAVTNVSFGNTAISSHIPAFQGFWVKAYHSSSNSASYTFTLKESHKADTADTFRKSGANGNEILALIQLTDPAGRKEKVGVHFWTGATAGFDHLYDIQRMAEVTPGSLQVAFWNDGKSLPLYVNAIPSGLYNYNIGLAIGSSAAGIHKLSFSNLTQLIDDFDCAILRDLVTGNSINLKEVTEYNFALSAPYTGKRFEILLGKKLAGNDFVVRNATCKGFNNGLLHVKLENHGKEANYSLIAGNRVLETFSGNITAIKKTLAPGEYRLVDNNSAHCTQEYAFVISEPEIVVADFEAATSRILAGKEVRFNDKSTGANHYLWYFQDDMSSSTEKNPSHSFKHPGFYNVTLSVSNDDPACRAEVSKKIRVQMKLLPGYVADDDNFITYTRDNNLYIINNLQEENVSLSICTTDGKVIYKTENMPAEQVIPDLREGNIYIVVLKSGDKVITRRVAF